MGKKFKRDINSLTTIFEYLAEFVVKNRLNKSAAFSLNLAVEEIFTNMVKYNPDNPNPIQLTLTKAPDALIAELIDYSAESFDITKTRIYDNTLSLEERPIGGVGIHLVKKMFDEIKYDYIDQQCKITLIKYLGVSDV